MKDLINLKDNHYIVLYNSKSFVVNGSKFPADELERSRKIELHPISNVGIINYNEILTVNSQDVEK